MVPKIITVANSKTGVGKTTVALQIAIARAMQGKDVWYVECDSEMSGLTALTLRTNKRQNTRLGCAYYPNGVLLGSQVTLQENKWDTIVIDVGGMHDDAKLRMAVGICDVLLMPFCPGTFDAWALSQMSTVIKDLSISGQRKIPAYAFWNCADPNESVDYEEALFLLSDYENIQILDTPLCRRHAYSTASSFGLGVAELMVKDAEAIAEIEKFAGAIFGEPFNLCDPTRRQR